MLALTAGCVDQQRGDLGAEADPSSQSSFESSPSSDSGETGGDSATGSGGALVIGDAVEPGQAVIVSASNVVGEVSRTADALVDDASRDAFVQPMDPRLAQDVRRAARRAQVPANSTLYGAVVAGGCDAPIEIVWTVTVEGIEVPPVLPKPGVECLVPVTWVALFLVPDSA